MGVSSAQVEISRVLIQPCFVMVQIIVLMKVMRTLVVGMHPFELSGNLPLWLMPKLGHKIKPKLGLT